MLCKRNKWRLTLGLASISHSKLNYHAAAVRITRPCTTYAHRDIK